LYSYCGNGTIQTILTFYNEQLIYEADNIMDWKQIDVENIIEPLNVTDIGKELTLRIVNDVFID